MMWLFFLVPVVVYFAFPGQVLKLQVAQELLGWDGLATVARQAAGVRLLGHRQTESRTELHSFLDLLARVDLEYCVPTRRIVSEDDLAECHRFLTHLVRSAFKLYYELDLDYPHLEPFVEPRVKVLGDNPDAFYYGTTFSPEHSYVVEGEYTGEVYVSLTVYEQKCVGCFVGKAIAALNNEEIKTEEDGNRFRVLIPGVGRLEQDSPGFVNVLKLDELPPGFFPQLISRHYFEDELSAQLNTSLRPKLTIRRLDPHTNTPKTHKKTPTQLSAQRFKWASNFVRSHSLEMLADPAKAPSWFSFKPNVFGPAVRFKQEATGAGAIDIVYSAGPFKFSPSGVEREGLLITGVMPECKFANIALWNKLLQTFGYEEGRRVSLNRKQLGVVDGGDYQILLSKRQPRNGLPKGVVWLDSEGRLEGQMFWRFLLVKDGHQVQTPKAQLVVDIDLL